MSPELISVRNRRKSHDRVERGSGSTSREQHCALSFIGKLGICFHGNPLSRQPEVCRPVENAIGSATWK
jgi:hypothetical protein